MNVCFVSSKLAKCMMAQAFPFPEPAMRLVKYSVTVTSITSRAPTKAVSAYVKLTIMLKLKLVPNMHQQALRDGQADRLPKL